MKIRTLGEYRRYTSAGLETVEGSLYCEKAWYKKRGYVLAIKSIEAELEKIYQVRCEREESGRGCANGVEQLSGGSGWRVREFSDDFTLDDEFYMDW